MPARKYSTVPKHLQPWMKHLMEYRKKHPNLTLKEAMIKARPSYKRIRKSKR